MLKLPLSSPEKPSLFFLASQKERIPRLHREQPAKAMRVLALLPLILPALLPAAGTTDPGQPCPTEMNKVKDLLAVNCTGQALSAVPQDLPVDTGILLLNDNQLASLSMDAFLNLTQLQDLDLADNGLVALHTGTSLPTLKELVLSRNGLGALPDLQGFPALTLLAVAHNSLVTLAPGAFLAVPQLQDLDLRGNQLQTLPQDAFKGLKALKDLDISDNLLEELPKELLQDLKALETLWLSGNHLRTLPTNFFPQDHLFAYIFLTENRWHCDCDLRYLRNWIRQNEGSVYQPERGLEKTKVEVAPEKVLCSSPPEHLRKPIIHFKPNNCGNVGDADEEEDENYDEEETMEKATTITITPAQTPSPAAILTAAPTSTALISTTSLPTTMSTSHPQTTFSANTTNTYAIPMVATGTFSTTSVALASTAMLEASSMIGSSSPPLTSTTSVVSTTMLSTHAPTPLAPLDTTHFTHPAPSPPPPPLPLCPCSTPVLASRAGGEGPQGGQWVLRHCCLLHWVLYLASLVLLVLTMLALAGWLAWMFLVGRHKSRQTQEVQGLLPRWGESTGSPVMDLSSFKSPHQSPTFCTIKEVELCPEVTYCTIKDLGIQHSSPACSSFRTTKELWVHHRPLNE
ncbi:platelet glycoprotein Ib alpha chain [Egretta garzetta]|uniref:platelet glycoprotein Ib alpha chain n=1 Tax=Egretta garzetta TaxID=188379 RepID=UPI00163D0CED|nr:platelet glycoprotein Ib alpha chain [Egretta garzetta]